MLAEIDNLVFANIKVFKSVSWKTLKLLTHIYILSVSYIYKHAKNTYIIANKFHFTHT